MDSLAPPGSLPAPAIVFPPNGTEVVGSELVLRGTAAPYSTVVLYDWLTVLPHVTADERGEWTVILRNVIPGTHMYRAAVDEGQKIGATSDWCRVEVTVSDLRGVYGVFDPKQVYLWPILSILAILLLGIAAGAYVHFFSDSSSGQAAAVADAPTAPGHLQARALSATSVRLSWDTVPRSTGYVVQIQNRGYRSSTTDLVLRNGLQKGTRYTWRVKAQLANSGGAWSDPAFFTLPAAYPRATLNPVNKIRHVTASLPTTGTLCWRSNFAGGTFELTVWHMGQHVVQEVNAPPHSGAQPRTVCASLRLATAGTYSWRVRAMRGSNAVATTGEWAALYLAAAPPPTPVQHRRSRRARVKHATAVPTATPSPLPTPTPPPTATPHPTPPVKQHRAASPPRQRHSPSNTRTPRAKPSPTRAPRTNEHPHHPHAVNRITARPTQPPKNARSPHPGSSTPPRAAPTAPRPTATLTPTPARRPAATRTPAPTPRPSATRSPLPAVSPTPEITPTPTPTSAVVACNNPPNCT